MISNAGMLRACRVQAPVRLPQGGSRETQGSWDSSGVTAVAEISASCSFD